jgi:hypothetical protein
MLIPLYHQYIGHPKKKINTELIEVNDTIDQIDLTDVYRIFHLTLAQYTFSACMELSLK